MELDLSAHKEEEEEEEEEEDDDDDAEKEDFKDKKRRRSRQLHLFINGRQQKPFLTKLPELLYFTVCQQSSSFFTSVKWLLFYLILLILFSLSFGIYLSFLLDLS